MNYNTRRVFDPLYGAVAFDETEFKLISSPEIQRLRYVRLCNINSLLVTGASEISRYEHCVGTMALAKHWARENPQALALQENDRRNLVFSALLHDIQTGPFGHSFQYVLEDNEFEEDFVHHDVETASEHNFHQLTRPHFSGKEFSVKEQLSGEYYKVASLIRGEGKLGILVSGTVDFDNLDNVFRLAFHVGLVERSIVPKLLDFVKDVCVIDNKLVINDCSISLLTQWYGVRKRLYELLLLDWAEFSAKGMLTKAIELSKEHFDADSWLYTDDAFIDFLENDVGNKLPKVKSLVKKLKSGELYEPISMFSINDISLYKKLSNIDSKRKIELGIKITIKKIFKSFSKDVLFHSILDVKKTCRKLNYVDKNGKAGVIGEDSSLIHIGVFISSFDNSQYKREQLDLLVKDYFRELGDFSIIDIKDPVGIDEDIQRGLDW